MAQQLIRFEQPECDQKEMFNSGSEGFATVSKGDLAPDESRDELLSVPWVT